MNLIIENVRRLSRDLSPVIIDDLGLDAGISNLISSFTRYHKVTCDIHVDKVSCLFGTHEQRLIYRLVQETLNNIAKHADATALKIEVRKCEDAVSIQLRDNGKGFNYLEVMRAPANHRGIGLSAMQERVNMVRGEMKITSEPGQGTAVLFSIPLTSGVDGSEQ